MPIKQMTKSTIKGKSLDSLDAVGRSYYIFCLEQALVNVKQARMLVYGDVTDSNHELPQLENLIKDALEAS